MFGKIDFKPRDPARVTLFANAGEAIVFWLSLAGLIFLGFVSVLRYLGRENVDSERIEAIQTELSAKIDILATQNRDYANRIEVLRKESKHSQRLVDSLTIELALLNEKVGTGSSGKRISNSKETKRQVPGIIPIKLPDHGARLKSQDLRLLKINKPN